MDSEAYEILQGTIEYSATIKRYRKSLKDLFLHHALACKEDTFSFRLRRRDGDLSLRERERRAEARRHQMYGGVEYISRGAMKKKKKKRSENEMEDNDDEPRLDLHNYLNFCTIMDMTKTSQITERDLVSIFMSSYRDPYRAVRQSMKRSCLVGLEFQEFLAAMVKIAEVIHDGTYKSRDTSWEEEDEERRIMEASDSMDRKLCCLFFHMWNTLNDKHNELQKGKFTKPFQVDEYARTTARSFMRRFLSDYNKGVYACLFGRRGGGGGGSETFPASFEFSPVVASKSNNAAAVMRRKQRRKSHIRKQIDVDDLYVMM